MDPICIGCMRRPHELEEYVEIARDEGISPVEYVIQEEGTLNPVNGHFLCTTCYIKAGAPSTASGWKTP